LPPSNGVKMKIFVSYSFRPETKWVEDYVVPLIRCFGHEAVTGKILDGGTIPDEIRRLIKTTQRVLCFTTRAEPIYDEKGTLLGHAPPDWVRDELMISRGNDTTAIEFREAGVRYKGAAPFSAWHDFDTKDLPALLLRLAGLLKEWPVGPLQLRIRVPEKIENQFDLRVKAGNLRAKCTAWDLNGNIIFSEEQPVRIRLDQFMVLFWVKPDPNMEIEIEIPYDRQRLVCTGLSPAICVAQLTPV
jgi:hypothetical protein